MTLRRLLSGLGRGALALLFLAGGLWGAGALHYHHPAPHGGDLWSWLFLALALAAALGVTFLPGARRAIPVFGIAFLALAGWWTAIKPAGGRAWAPELAEIPYMTRDGDKITVTNVRDFVWRSESDFTPRWETRTYDLSKLVSTDLIAVYWDAGPAIAHTMVSFGFEDGRHLAFSIEVRHGPGEPYEALPGLFKKYELIFIAADERDVLGLRHVRKEEPYLFKLRIDPARARPLFLEYLARSSELRQTPAFYNTVTSNCTTVIFSMVRKVGFDPPWNWRVLVSGYLPDLAWSEGLLDTDYPIAKLRELGAVAPKYRDGLDSVAFSAAIRQGVPGP
ncbi:MAG: DUF4105 domain-containing protein [Beijerinckiaceae bacterium]